jgi:hypothetical protein
MGRICRNPERYADRVEFAYVDEAAHFITDDAPAAVAEGLSGLRCNWPVGFSWLWLPGCGLRR